MPNTTVAYVLGAAAATAAASLALPFAPLFDPWAWLVWGRELTELELDTAAGPSWKPLPALIAAVLTPAGDAAPDLWLWIARTAWLAVPVFAWRLAARLEGSAGRRAVLAGALAAVAVLLLHDGVTSWTRQATGGLSEPLLAVLVLAAVDAALTGSVRVALLLAFAACLVRPETWPFAALYAWRLIRDDRVSARAVVAGGLAVALLWLGPDLLGAGNAFEGAERARQAGGSPPIDALETLGRALLLPLAVLWIGAAGAWLDSARRSPIRVLLAGSLAWIVLVAVLAAAGYAGLPRFMAPAAVVVSAVGAAGLVRLVGGLRPYRVATAALALALAVGVGWRAAEMPGEIERARDEAAALDELFALTDAERATLTDCRPLWTSDFLVHTALAWRLELSLSDVGTTRSVVPSSGTLLIGPRSDPALAREARSGRQPLADSGEWSADRVGPCSETVASGTSGALDPM